MTERGKWVASSGNFLSTRKSAYEKVFLIAQQTHGKCAFYPFLVYVSEDLGRIIHGVPLELQLLLVVLDFVLACANISCLLEKSEREKIIAYTRQKNGFRAVTCDA